MKKYWLEITTAIIITGSTIIMGVIVYSLMDSTHRQALFPGKIEIPESWNMKAKHVQGGVVITGELK